LRPNFCRISQGLGTVWALPGPLGFEFFQFWGVFQSENDMSNAVIEIRNLSKIYRDFWGRKKVQAVKSLSLDVMKGEVFGLLGPNGSGKTTTMKMLLGLLFPTSGEMTILGKPASDVSKNERIGYLPEESYLYRFLNADETLDFYGRLFDMPAAERARRSDELIEMVGLGKARRRQLKEYSKGMTRRIGLAQALINDPDLVLLDEPTSGLDPIGTREMKDLIHQLKAQGKTVVMCSHQLADVQDVCDRIAVLFQGELKVLGRVDELLELRNEMQIRTTSLTDAAMADVRKVLEKHNVTDVEFSRPKADLEQLFLRTVRESGERPGRRFSTEEVAASGKSGNV
jgi:ABC-2 type transport system ATP-binding protein